MADELTQEDRKLLSEVNFKVQSLNNSLGDLKRLLFGDSADGFMYRFARIEPDIEAIPEIRKKLDAVAKDADDLSKAVRPIIDIVSKHEDYIKTQTIAKTLIVVAISIVTSITVSILTLWTMINKLLLQFSDKGVK